MDDQVAIRRLADDLFVLTDRKEWAAAQVLFAEGPEIWETWGNYRLSFRRTPAGWRISAFRYFAKFNRGNDAIRTHTVAKNGEGLWIWDWGLAVAAPHSAWRSSSRPRA